VDITELMEAEEALRRNEAELRALFAAMKDVIVVFDAAGRYLKIAPTNPDLLYRPAEEMLGKSLHEVMPADQADHLLACIQRVVRTRQMNNIEYSVLIDDRELWFTAAVYPLFEDYVVWVARDITERKQAEKELLRSRDELTQANLALEKAAHLKDEFLASMSHELRTPLTGILGLTEVLQKTVYGPLNDKQLQTLRTIEESGRHLLNLINDILDLSKIEAGKLELQMATVGVDEVCQASLRLIKQMAQAKRQNVMYTASPTGVALQADMRRLKQILVNLLSNAVKFTPAGGELGIEVQGDPAEGLVHFTVWDKGIGIAPEALPKLFKPFVQLDSRLSREYSGTGLGLALVRRLAEMHGGHVGVQSTPGQGSRFTVTLPWRAPTSPLRKSGTGPLRQSLTVEGREIEAEQLTRHLADLGIANIVHPRAEGAVELATRVRPGIILVDANLPGKDGWSVLTALKANPDTRDIPVVMMVETDDPPQAGGLAGCLVKPYTLTDLRAQLERATVQVPLGTAPVLIVEAAPHKPLILLVEDNRTNIDLMSAYLSNHHFNFIVAHNGREAVQLAQTAGPDLILMDIQMPKMDGLEATRQIRALANTPAARVPIIALTALAMPGDRERCLAAGADDYLSKPVKMDDLIHTIQHYLVERGPITP
jgi:PAS domain S-box-containing protein